MTPSGGDPLDRAQELLSRGWAEAARELVETSGGFRGKQAWRSSNLVGKSFVVREDPDTAARWFARAEEALPAAPPAGAALGIGMNRAMVEVQRGHYDLALRGMGALEPLLVASPDALVAQYWINLAVCQLNLNYFPPALGSLERAEQHLAGDGGPMARAVSVNRGIVLAETDRLDAARSLFVPALADAHDADRLRVLVELARLEFRAGNVTAGMDWVTQAVRHFWTSWIAFHGVELGYVCEVAAMLARHLGAYELSRRLAERALIRYGQASLWREWRGLSTRMEEWGRTSEVRSRPGSAAEVDALGEFLTLIDFMAAQDLVEPGASLISDLRIQTVEAMGATGATGSLETMGHGGTGTRLGEDIPLDGFVWVSRLSDVGLGAMEPGVASQPDRSPAAWARFTKHPELSLKLLRDMDLSGDVRAAILDHHELWNGQGFPAGKSGPAVHLWARWYRVADVFARALSRGLSHSAAVAEVDGARRAGMLDPACTERFRIGVGSLLDGHLIETF